MRNNMKEREQT